MFFGVLSINIFEELLQHFFFMKTTLDYQINVAYEIDVVLGILVKINKRSLWNKRSPVIFD